MIPWIRLKSSNDLFCSNILKYSAKKHQFTRSLKFSSYFKYLRIGLEIIRDVLFFIA